MQSQDPVRRSRSRVPTSTIGLLVIAALLGGVGRCRGGQPKTVVGNGVVRVQFDKASGGIVSVLDRVSNTEFAGATATPLFELDFVEPTLHLTAADANSVSFARSGDIITITFAGFSASGLTVTCRFWPEAGTSLVLGSIAIASTVDRTLASFRFPSVPVGLPIGGSAVDDRLLLPLLDGYMVRDPLNAWTDRSLAYPGGASMQFQAAFDPTAGIYLAAHDAAGTLKTLDSTAIDAQTVQLSVTHHQVEQPARLWTAPYDMALTTFAGASGFDTRWEDAADLYRSWGLEQAWCATTLEQRVASADVPAWLAQPSLFMTFSVAGDGPSGPLTDRLSLIPGFAEALRSVLGGPVTVMLMGWEKQGPWVAPDYFPPVAGGEAAYLALSSQLHALGHRSMLYLSGLNWTLIKNGSGTILDNTAAFNANGRVHALTDAAGQAYTLGTPTGDVGQYAMMCPTTSGATTVLRGPALHAVDTMGMDAVQADQILGGGLPPCYHPGHPHGPGGGNWNAAALRNLFASIRQQGKASNADFAFSMEEPGEFFIPVLDTYHAREYKQVDWPRDGTNVVGVPLFTHVYHECVHGYGGDSVGVSAVSTPPDPNAPVALYQQAMNLVSGKAPAVAIWSEWGDPTMVVPSQQRLLRDHFRLWNPTNAAHDFLLYGRRLSTEPLNVPDIILDFWDPTTASTVPMAFPSVLHSAWTLPGGATGWVFASISSAPITFTALGQSITLAPGEATFR